MGGAQRSPPEPLICFGRICYVGRVGTGWDREAAREIRRALQPLARSTAPLTKPLKKADTTWVEPRFDAEIAYAEFTDDGMVRHPSFKRLVEFKLPPKLHQPKTS
jgi:bifunctional non-homologous end joining protein LigD